MAPERSTLAELAGKLPDAEVAALTDSSIQHVLSYRRAHGIQPFVRMPPGTPKAVVPTASVSAEPSAAPASPRRRKDSAEQRLEAYRDRLGTVADSEIAEISGVSAGVVGAVRRRLGIPAYSGFLWVKGHKPLGGRVRKGAEPARGRVDDIERFAELVGTVSDAVVAEKAGVSRSLVTAWRKKRGIAAAHPHRGRKATPTDRPVRSAAPAPRRAGNPSSGGLAFSVVAVQGERRVTFAVVAGDLQGAALKAQAALGAQWEIAEMRLLGEALPGSAG